MHNRPPLQASQLLYLNDTVESQHKSAWPLALAQHDDTKLFHRLNFNQERWNATQRPHCARCVEAEMPACDANKQQLGKDATQQLPCMQQ